MEPNENDLRKENRGREAQQLLESPLLIEALGSVKTACLTKFESESLTAEQLDELWRTYRIALKVEGYLKKAVREGADATKLLMEQAKTDAVNGQGK